MYAAEVLGIFAVHGGDSYVGSGRHHQQAVGGDVFSVTPSNKSNVDYLGESTKGDLNVKLEQLEAFGIDGHAAFEGPIEEVARTIPGAVRLVFEEPELGVTIVKLTHTDVHEEDRPVF
ncbi:Cytosolic purine 5-nucleotidase [Sesbania bispinosa]|nr:Cytosolic purine 5-nucleotidase [Sesbania bispinosa]